MTDDIPETKKDELRAKLSDGKTPPEETGERHTALPSGDEKSVTTADKAGDATVAAGVEEHGNALASPEVEDETTEKKQR